MYSHDSFKKEVQKGMTGKTLFNCSIKNRNMTFIYFFVLISVKVLSMARHPTRGAERKPCCHFPLHFVTLTFAFLLDRATILCTELQKAISLIIFS